MGDKRVVVSADTNTGPKALDVYVGMFEDPGGKIPETPDLVMQIGGVRYRLTEHIDKIQETIERWLVHRAVFAVTNAQNPTAELRRYPPTVRSAVIRAVSRDMLVQLLDGLREAE